MVDEKLKYLSKLTNLQKIRLGNNQSLKGENLECLSECVKLQELNLTNCALTNKGLYSLSKLINLQRINLPHITSFTDEGLYYLQALPNLQYIIMWMQ